MVVDLPAGITVKKIFELFLSSKGVGKEEDNKGEEQQQQQEQEKTSKDNNKKGKNSARKDAEWTHFCDAMTRTFESALPVMLLYKEERPQFELIIQDIKKGDNQSSSR